MQCANCNKKLGLFSEKFKHQQKIYCPECYHSIYRFQYEAIPDNFIGKSLNLITVRVHTTDDRVITAKRLMETKNFAIHVLLYVKESNEFYSGCTSVTYIGIETCSGRVFRISETYYHDGGPDDHDTNKIYIYEITQDIWDNFISSRSDLIRERFKDFSIENAKQYLNFATYNLNYYKRFDLIYPSSDKVTIISAYAEYELTIINQFTKTDYPFTCWKRTLPATLYYDLKRKKPHMIDLLSLELGLYCPDSTYINKKPSLTERGTFTNKMEALFDELKNICNIENDRGSSNVLYFENGGAHIQQTYIDDETMTKLVNKLENIAQFKKFQTR